MTRLSACEESEDQVVQNKCNKQNEQICRKRKRHLEVLSITCSTLGINLVIACFLGATNGLGFKSAEMAFQSAFAFLLLSVVLGVMAMIESTNKREWSQSSWFLSPKISLFGGVFKRRRNKSSEQTEKIARVIYDESNNSKSSPLKISGENGFKQATTRCPPGESATVFKGSQLLKQSYRKVPSAVQVNGSQSSEIAFSRGPGNGYKQNSSDLKNFVGHTNFRTESMPLVLPRTSGQNETSNFRSKQVEKLPRVNENTFSPEVSALNSFDLSQWKDMSSREVHLQLKKKHSAYLFGQTTTVLSPSQFSKTSRFVFYDVENNSNKTAGSFPVIEEKTFITEFSEIPFQKQIIQRGWFGQMTEKGFVSYRMQNAQAIANHNYQRRFTSFDEASWELPKDQVSAVASKLNQMNFKF